MGLPERLDDKHYTYGDSRLWPDDERWELIDGVAFWMAKPSFEHQAVSMELSYQLTGFLKGKPCRVLAAPFDVLFYRLAEQDENTVDTVLQPDLLVICDRNRVRSNSYWGPPSLVIEILSPSTSSRDLRLKHAVYQRSGVQEYWIIDPKAQWLQQYVLLPNGSYGPEKLLVREGKVTCAVLEGFELDILSLWPDF